MKVSSQSNKPSSRSFIGMALFLVGLGLYAFLAAGIGGLISDWHLAFQMIYYAIAGLLWIIPVKRLLEWMGGQ